MGWIFSIATRFARTSRAFILAAGLASVAPVAHAQIVTIQNQYLVLGVGSGVTTATDAGTISLSTTPGNPVNPTAGTSVPLLVGGPIEATNATTVTPSTLVYVRIDGGRTAGGNDYIFGRQTEGTWLSPPTVVNNHIEARWKTLAQTVNTVVVDPQIEIDLVASFVHDQARFQFTIKNIGTGQTHTVGLAFLQRLGVGTLGGPIRVPNGPYLRRETLLQAGQVPTFWDIFALGTAANTTVPGGLSIRGILGPLTASQTEPTRPTRFGYGNVQKLSGVGNPVANVLFPGRNFDFIWNFQPDTSLTLNSTASNPAVIDYWDGQAVAAGQTITDITYVGESSSNFDLSPPMALALSGPVVLGYNTVKDANGNPTSVTATPSPFTVSAFVTNLTDIINAGTGIPIAPVTMFLDLPKGLILASGETNPKTISSVLPGQEGAVAWQVLPDPANPVNGQISYTVNASPNFGNGKSVQRTIEIPVPAGFTLPGTVATQGLYRMISLPLATGNTPPSTILNLRADQPAPDFDLVRFNPTLGHYEPVNAFVPGNAYWLRSRLTTDKQITINTIAYPPIDNQIQPGAVAFKAIYPRGWNQIGDPDIYQVRFSEIQVLDQATGVFVDAATAADQLHQWIQPAVFFYDTTDANPQNWHYVLESNLGFTMVPYQGYWIFVKRDGLQFLYPGVDTPGASVTRGARGAASVGAPRSRALANDWTLQIRARGAVSADYTTTIGMNVKAGDNQDYYKITKPPVQENQLSLDIVHKEWDSAARYAQDLRSASPNRKTWQMVLTSSKPSEAVTFSWPDLGTSVPRNYRLTLIDTDSNSRYDMRSTSSVVLTTNTNKTRNVQVVLEPSRGSGPALITSFDVAQASGRASGAPSSVSINYTLSQAADTRIIIRTASGRVLRTLTGQPVTGGASNSGRAVFDLRDSQGRSISTGVYNAELVAQGSDGQVSRQVRPFVLAR